MWHSCECVCEYVCECVVWLCILSRMWVWVWHSIVRVYEWVMSPKYEAYMDKSSHIWMNHVKYEWYLRLQTLDCVCLRMSHVMYECVIAHVNESCHVWLRRGMYEYVVSRINVRHATHGWVMSHMDESCHMWMSHVTCGWVMSHVGDWYLRQIRHQILNCCFVFHLVLQRLDLYNYIWDMTRLYVTWFIHTWRDSLICVASLSIAILSSTLCCSGSICTFINGTWLVYTWHDLFIRDVTHWYVSQASQLPFCLPPCAAAARSVYIPVGHDSSMCDMTHWYVSSTLCCSVSSMYMHIWDMTLCMYIYGTWLAPYWRV